MSVSEPNALRVVVVDDSEVFRQKICRLLISSGFEVAGEAPDGAAGMEVIAKAKPDVVIMDLQMPGMSGIEATWQLGSVAPDARVLILTSPMTRTTSQMRSWPGPRATC